MKLAGAKEVSDEGEKERMVGRARTKFNCAGSVFFGRDKEAGRQPTKGKKIGAGRSKTGTGQEEEANIKMKYFSPKRTATVNS